MKPILKYRGGKSKEIKYFEKLIPKFNRYVEPFMGGGGVYFYLEPENALLNDINKRLINFYQGIQKDYQIIRKELDFLGKEYARKSLQKIPDNQISTYKDLCIVVHARSFGLDRDTVVQSLNREGIPTRNYFSPPIHKMDCYSEYNDLVLENTENISKNIICLPMYPFLTYADIEMIVNILRNIHINAEEIKKRVIQDA